jgi:flagellar secretion chaperone FliS
VQNQSAVNRYVNDGTGVVPQPRLLVMLYDRLVLDLEQAEVALDGSNIVVANERLLHAQQILFELQSALDREVWDGAENLGQLYLWFNTELANANVKKDAKKVRTCLKLIRQLNQAWHGAYESVMAEQSAAAGVSAASTNASA